MGEFALNVFNGRNFAIMCLNGIGQALNFAITFLVSVSKS